MGMGQSRRPLGAHPRRGLLVTPTWEIWPCQECGNPGVRNLGADGYCSTHLHDLYDAFGPEAWVDGGVGLQDGPLRPEYGPLEADLKCCCCEAAWTGIPGDPCWWCRRAREIQLEHQIDLLLTPPDVHPDDATYDNKMRGWVARMRVGAEAGLITDQQAQAAFRSTQRKTAA